jgi:peptidyl-tRNA hydrolase, PTH1 family
MKHILIIGLGNPGQSYNNTRHNIGFSFIDLIADSFSFPAFSTKFSSLVSSNIIGNYKITIVKPQTFMNLSGQAVGKIMQFYKIPPEDLIVIHDDLDLDLARVKMKINGGPGGHNGIKSIDQHLGKNYYRVRIGIGKPDINYDTSNFVLSKFTKDEKKIIEILFEDLLTNFELIMDKNMPDFMNKISMEYKKYGI